jgi:coenzyme F420-dependent glucose-6-phosphate dehydrogenase
MGDMLIGYHASHEQIRPGHLLEFVQHAERAGFDAAMCSDHLQPWSERQGQAGFAWSWLGAALATTRLTFGSVTAPGQRYHPVIVAQAAATLADMFPDRYWMAVGSGEALNESVTGDAWPPKAERNARLLESVDFIRALFRGETLDHRGTFAAREARLWTRPARPPAIIGAALTPATARWMGSWADGLITVARPGNVVQQVVDAFREGGGEGKPMYLQVHLSHALETETARAVAHEQWRTNVLGTSALAELPSPAAFDAAAQHVRPEDMIGPVRVSADLNEHTDWLAADLDLGFERLYLHHVGRDQAGFIEAFGRHVLPRLRGRPAPSGASREDGSVRGDDVLDGSRLLQGQRK